MDLKVHKEHKVLLDQLDLQVLDLQVHKEPQVHKVPKDLQVIRELQELQDLQTKDLKKI